MLIRRQLILALGLTLALGTAAYLAHWHPRALALVPAAAVLATGLLRGRHGVSLRAVARQLDRELGLAERLGTAYELECAEPDRLLGELERRVVDESGATLAEITPRGNARSLRARQEWLALTALALAVAGVLAAPGLERSARGVRGSSDTALTATRAPLASPGRAVKRKGTATPTPAARAGTPGAVRWGRHVPDASPRTAARHATPSSGARTSTAAGASPRARTPATRSASAGGGSAARHASSPGSPGTATTHESGAAPRGGDAARSPAASPLSPAGLTAQGTQPATATGPSTARRGAATHTPGSARGSVPGGTSAGAAPGVTSRPRSASTPQLPANGQLRLRAADAPGAGERGGGSSGTDPGTGRGQPHSRAVNASSAGGEGAFAYVPFDANLISGVVWPLVGAYFGAPVPGLP